MKFIQLPSDGIVNLSEIRAVVSDGGSFVRVFWAGRPDDDFTDYIGGEGRVLYEALLSAAEATPEGQS